MKIKQDFISYNTLHELHKFISVLIIICVNYILRTNDLHYENIIAHGEFPVIVDLETIMTNVHVKLVLRRMQTIFTLSKMER